MPRASPEPPDHGGAPKARWRVPEQELARPGPLLVLRREPAGDDRLAGRAVVQCYQHPLHRGATSQWSDERSTAQPSEAAVTPTRSMRSRSGRPRKRSASSSAFHSVGSRRSTRSRSPYGRKPAKPKGAPARRRRAATPAPRSGSSRRRGRSARGHVFVVDGERLDALLDRGQAGEPLAAAAHDRHGPAVARERQAEPGQHAAAADDERVPGRIRAAVRAAATSYHCVTRGVRGGARVHAARARAPAAT